MGQTPCSPSVPAGTRHKGNFLLFSRQLWCKVCVGWVNKCTANLCTASWKGKLIKYWNIRTVFFLRRVTSANSLTRCRHRKVYLQSLLCWDYTNKTVSFFQQQPAPRSGISCLRYWSDSQVKGLLVMNQFSYYSQQCKQPLQWQAPHAWGFRYSSTPVRRECLLLHNGRKRKGGGESRSSRATETDSCPPCCRSFVFCQFSSLCWNLSGPRG